MVGKHFCGVLFEPLGYEVEAARVPLDEEFPEWGDGPYLRVSVSGEKTLSGSKADSLARR